MTDGLIIAVPVAALLVIGLRYGTGLNGWVALLIAAAAAVIAAGALSAYDAWAENRRHERDKRRWIP